MVLTKDGIRRKIWKIMEKHNIAVFPRPVWGRIPNFKGHEVAAARLIKHRVFKRAEIVFCCPDSPQRPVREAVIRAGKTLIMATPRLRQGFIIIESGDIPRGLERKASTIRGAFQFGRTVDLFPFKIDLKVTGCVAVTPDGCRVGKGGGYSDLEYAILKELNLISDETPIATTVHDVQVVDYIPMTRHDMPVDYIFTPTRAIEVNPRRPRPPGIILEELDPRKIDEIPILKKIVRNRKSY